MLGLVTAMLQEPEDGSDMHDAAIATLVRLFQRGDQAVVAAVGQLLALTIALLREAHAESTALSQFDSVHEAWEAFCLSYTTNNPEQML
jgi:hypothetical protein